MFDRMSMMVGAGVVTAGVLAAMLSGAGVAMADSETGAGSESSTSDTSDPGGARSEPDDSGTPPPKTRDRSRDDADTDADVDTEADPDTEAAPDIEVDPDTEAAPDTEVDPDTEADPDIEVDPDTEAAPDIEVDPDTAADVAQEPDVVDVDSSAEIDDTAVVEADTTTAEVDEPVADVAEPVTGETEQPGGSADAAVALRKASPADDAAAKPTPAETRLAMVTTTIDEPSAQAAAPRQTLLSIVGTIVFNLYSFAVRVFGGPPLLPWGSTTTVRTSRLAIDCGDGYEVPANWYVPEGPAPTRLIYLQHGFLAAGPFYSYTATRLAEATGSIVVTTTLTSNFLACDGCWVGGSPMHRAVADLFVDGNTALADSAHAAGYSPALLNGVHDVVLIGHSAGGGLAAGAGGYMADNGTIDRLAGVVMLDGVGFGDVVPEALTKLPDEVPIYNLAGKAYFWNMNGSSGIALEEARPGEFTGVRLVGGLHSDTMLGGNPLVQAGLNLVTGWSRVENVKAAEVLSAAWINDMFAGAPTPGSRYYGAAGDLLEIDTPRGTATAYVMPGPPQRLTLIDRVFQFFSNLVFGINFETCVVPSAENGPLSAPNTALSLDEGAKPGQSIAQRCMQG